jgi:hypothetical protein
MRILPIVLITDDKALAIEFSRSFTRLDSIALILECPRVERQDYKAEILRTNNLLALLRPQILILGNISERLKELLIPLMSNIKIIEARRKEDWEYISLPVSTDKEHEYFTDMERSGTETGVII